MDTIDFKSFFESSPGLYLVLTPEFTIVAASDAYLLATMTIRSEISGRNIFDVFPDNPNDNTADGVNTLRESLLYTLKYKLPHTMAVQKYDIRTPNDEFVEKYWSPLNKPLLNNKNEVVYIIHRVEDVTDYILLKKQQEINNKANEALREQFEIFNRGREIQNLNRVLESQVVEQNLEISDKEKKKVEAEIKAVNSEKRFRALIEKSADMKTLSTLEGKITYASPSITRILGYTAEEFMNLNSASLIHPDDIPQFKAKREAIVNIPGASFYNQHRTRHKDGHWVWCESTLTNLLHEPNINAFVSNFRDISERKAAEEQREFDSNNLNALINNTKDLMWSVDKDYNVITFNEAFEKSIYYFSGEAIKKGQNILKVSFSPDLLSKFEKYYASVFSGETFTVVETLTEPKEIWFEISFYPIRKGNEIIGAACYSHDITNRKLAEQKIKESETFNKTVLNALNSHIAVINSEGVIVAVNDAWIKFGLENYTSGEDNNTIHKKIGIGSNYFDACEMSYLQGDLIAKDILKGVKSVMFDGVQMFSTEYPFIKENITKWFAMRVLKLDSKEPMVVVAILDITERKLSEIERLKITQDLILRNKDLEQFSYIVSHNLRAPVANIIGLSEVLQSNGLDTTLHPQIMNSLSVSVNRLDEVIIDLNNILATKHALDEKKTVIKFSDIADDVFLSMEHIIEKEGAKLEWDFSAVNEIVSMRSYMYSIFVNLISNSLKYRQAGLPPVIDIRSQLQGNSIELHFSDNGLGIDLQKKGDQVFGLYKRFHIGSVEGKGMGLFMVKTQVESLGGSIQIESEPNKGTKFIISFNSQ